MNPLTRESLLSFVDVKGPTNTTAVASALNVEHDVVVGVLKSVQSFGEVLDTKEIIADIWSLNEEGKAVAVNGSPEALVTRAATTDGVSREDINSVVGAGVGKIGLGKAIKNKWIKTEKKDGNVLVVRLVEDFIDETQILLQKIESEGAAALDKKVMSDLKKRKLIEKKVMKSYNICKGPEFALTLVKKETDLTPEMLANGSWETKNFKQFNLNAMGTPIDCGALHPLLKVRTEYRQIFLEMGFEEMPTSKYVESSFWNFDALFQPQQHPARDAHDTFFLRNPERSTDFPPEYLERVKKTHEDGGYGSQGYNYDWKIEEAQKNILRTHTTAVSARMLYALAQNKPFKPVKYFSIDRVFRNETLDATHLAEFHQIEGVIADYNLTLGDLMGTLDQFFKRLGIENLKFKPAYNPYTEPSMEVFSYHEGLDKVVEIGNSGVFRPEMLQPMGLPEDVVVIAWGLSLERPTMIKYKYQNIRDLIGPSINLQSAKEKPIVRV
eukprot:m.44020 g.44020  ORF g.44020 m.44020 type:complete len:496 (-) comp10578_c0_seq1:132-1619(-)